MQHLKAQPIFYCKVIEIMVINDFPDFRPQAMFCLQKHPVKTSVCSRAGAESIEPEPISIINQPQEQRHLICIIEQPQE